MNGIPISRALSVRSGEMAGAGEHDAADRQGIEHPMVSIERRGVAFSRPLGLERRPAEPSNGRSPPERLSIFAVWPVDHPDIPTRPDRIIGPVPELLR